MIGQTLLHYRITRELGAGGMGQVYLADDTELNRQVALKVLPESVREDPERLCRFRTEAKSAAKLNHPNIAQIYALEEAMPADDGTDDGDRHDVGADTAINRGSRHDVRAYCNTPLQSPATSPILFIVMEYVPGKTLTGHIPQDGLALDRFFEWFLPLSDALAHAHEHHITHRDLKPENIMISQDGMPKILDFGLARIAHSAPPPEEFDSQAPTMTMDPDGAPEILTVTPQFLGTPPYMSPEQASMEEVDHRTDLFSFGTVMYEALTGKRPFTGKTKTEIVSSVLKDEPVPVGEVKPDIPRDLERIVTRCLRKDLRARYQTALDLSHDLAQVQKDVETGVVAGPVSVVRDMPVWRRPMAILGISILTLIIVTTWLLKPVPSVSEPPLRKFEMAVDLFGGVAAYNGPAISPDGTMIAYSQGDGWNGLSLWIRDLDTVTARELPDTRDAFRPFWSPNSDFVAYFTLNPWALRKVAVAGGPSIHLCDMPANLSFARGGVWRPDGTIVFSVTPAFSDAGVLYTVPSQGGEPVVFAVADSSLDRLGLIYPALLPDGALLYAATVGETDGALMVQKGQERRVILPIRGERAAFPVYSPTGHIVYQRGFPESRGIWAVPFDAGLLGATGESFPVNPIGSYPTVSSDGTLVHRTGEAAFYPPGRLAWVDRQGRVKPAGKVWEGLSSVSLSPDGRKAAFTAEDEDIRVYDFEQDTATRMTYDPALDMSPVWSPAGRWLAYQSYRSGFGDIYVRRTDGSGNAELLVGGPEGVAPGSWSRDGRHLIYFKESDGTGYDIWYTTLHEKDGTVVLDGTPQVFLRTSYYEGWSRLSPDGRYLAYSSNESGQYEVYVRPFPNGDSKWQVSLDGGRYPQWSPEGGELFYLEEAMAADRGPIMAVPVEMSGGFRPGRVRKLFDAPEDVDLAEFDVSADGRRFLAIQRVGKAEQPQITITVVQNWAKEFEGRE